MTKNKETLLWVLILSMILLFSSCESQEIIAEGLSQQEANIIVVVLREHDVLAEKIGIANRKSTTYNIAVNKKQAKDALKVLVYEQLPKTQRPGLKEIYPPGSSGLIPTKSDEQARLIMAQEGELEAMLKILPNIVDARVALSIDQNPDSFKTNTARSAAVTLTFKPQDDNDELPISSEEIANLVSSAVGSLTVEQVMVVMKPLKAMLQLPNKTPLPKAGPEVAPSKGTSTFLLWGLLGLTFGALILAAYAFMRPKLQASEP